MISQKDFEDWKMRTERQINSTPSNVVPVDVRKQAALPMHIEKSVVRETQRSPLPTPRSENEHKDQLKRELEVQLSAASTILSNLPLTAAH